MSAPSNPFYAALSLTSHVYFSPILGALVRGGVPDHLDAGPLPAAELAQRAELDTLSLTRALRALAAFGAFQETSPGVFANTPVSNLFRTGGGLQNCALFYSLPHVLGSAAALGHSVTTGESATVHVFGESVWQHMSANPEEAATFNRALAELRGDEHQRVADAYEWPDGATVVDVGGGAGSLLASILAKRSSLHGVLIDQPFVLPDAEHLLAGRGVRERCELVGASFFDAIPATGEIWTMCQVLHDWPDADCRAILTRCRAAMRPTDRLLVCEMLTVPCQPSPHVAMVDMAMLMYFGEARQRTVEEYSALFDATGFGLVRVLPTTSAFSIVEAKPV
jgi:hypothetical protein